MNKNLLAPILLATTVLSACAIDNDPSIHYTRTVSLGQELLELQQAREAGAITSKEYQYIKAKLLQQLALIPHKKPGSSK